MRLLVLDTETTGLDAESCDVIEIACALYDVGSRSLLTAHSWLLPGPPVPPEIEAITGISAASLEAAAAVARAGAPSGQAAHLEALADLADVVVAHNSPFDRSFLGKLSPRWLDRRWVDSEVDITYPRERGSKRLIHLAADNGVWMPGHHRALADVMMLVALLAQVPDLEAQITRALKPRVLVQAIVSYDDREKAKARGFGWNAGARRWEKAIPADEVDAFRADLPFPIRVLPGERAVA